MLRSNFLFFAVSCAALFLCSAVAAAETKPATPALPNQLTAEEKAAGWKLLFDGRTPAGWRTFKSQAFPAKGWTVENGCLKHLARERGGDIISRDPFDNFDLRFEWKIAPGANSGLKYFVTENRDAPLGHEYQLIDDAVHPDAKRGPKWQTGAFYDVLPPTNVVLRPVGQFNQSRIVVAGNHVEHWLNGAKVLEYEAGGAEVRNGVAQSKFKNVKDFGFHLKGYLLLQDHGDEICFRNLKIRERREGELPGP